VRHPNSIDRARSPSRTLVDVHDLPPSDDLANGADRALRDQTDVVSKHPLQLLLVELLQRPLEFTTYASEDYQDILDARGIVCSMSRWGNCWDNAVMESFFSTVKSELGERFDSHGEAKMELFDYIEVFYNQRRRHSTLGQISPAEFERRKNEEGVDPMDNRKGRGFPQAPHPSPLSLKEETITKNDQLSETVH
jgi:Integrase core domain